MTDVQGSGGHPLRTPVPPATLQIGDWQVDIFECGSLALDGGAMFGPVPRTLWERRIAPDPQHRIPLAMRLLLLRRKSGTEKVLVDTGIGDKYDTRFQSMFDVQTPEGSPKLPVEHALAAYGVALEEISHVVLTHMHFDHGGGVSRRDGQEGLAPVFSDAEHFLQRRNLETAQKPNAREKASYLPENVEPLLETRLHLLNGPEEILPGLSVAPSDGHTQGMQTLRIEGGGQVAYYLADLAPTHHHLHLPFTMGYDICAREILDEKQALFTRALAEEATLIFEHDPQTAVGRIGQAKGKFCLQ